jgi:hypothetical protein
MVKAPHNFHVSHYDIIHSAERMGYDGYIPLNVVVDIAYMRMYAMLHVEGVIDRPSPYTTTLQELLALVNADAIETNDPIEFAVNVFKLISPRVNLRHAEYNRYSGDTILIDIKCNQVNYKEDIALVSPEHLELLGVDTTVPANEVVLSDEVLDIIRFYNGMKHVTGELFPTRVTQVARISRLSDIHKIRKYRFALPSFKTDIALKKPFIRESKVVMNQNNSVVIMVDISWSTSNNPRYYSIVKAVLLSLLDTFVDGVTEVTVLEFHNMPSKEVVLTTREELKAYVNYKFTPVVSARGWKGVYNHIKKYDGDSVIFITDGLEDISNFPPNIKLYGVSTNRNKRLHDLCVNSGGKLVLV